MMQRMRRRREVDLRVQRDLREDIDSCPNKDGALKCAATKA
jgi:hypothetical protein